MKFRTSSSSKTISLEELSTLLLLVTPPSSKVAKMTESSFVRMSLAWMRCVLSSPETFGRSWKASLPLRLRRCFMMGA